MAITLKQPYYISMITFVNTVAAFYSKVASREGITTVAGALHDMAQLREECKNSQRKFTAIQSDHDMVKANLKALAYFKTQAGRIDKLFVGLENGLRTKQIGSKTALRAALKESFKPLVDDIVNHAKKFDVDSSEHNIDTLTDLIKANTTTSTVAHMIQKAVDAKESDSTKTVDKEHEKQVRDSLQSYRKAANSLPSSLKGALFTVVRLPVVPSMDFSLLSEKVLRTSGVEYSTIDRDAFVVFEDQVLLAFDFDAATTEESGKRSAPSSATFKNKREPVLGKDGKPMFDADGKAVTKAVRVANKTSLKARQLSAKHNELQEEFVLSIVEQINKRFPEKFTLMSQHFEFHPQNGKIAFAWLMPTRSHRVFQTLGNLSKVSWGFPWGKMKHTDM